MESADKDAVRPTAEAVFTPWELEGQSRRDIRPHRAAMLRRLAWLSLLVGAGSWVCLVPPIIGFALGLTAWQMARRDLDLMRRGEMDTSGRCLTEKARSNAHAGAVLSFLGLLPWTLLTAYACLAYVMGGF